MDGKVDRSKNLFFSPRTVRLVGCAIFILLGAVPAWRSSPTYDEVGLLAAGISHWTTGVFELFAVNPPLIRLIASLPAVMMGYEINPQLIAPFAEIRSEFQVGIDFLSRYESFHWAFFSARIVCLVITATGLYCAALWVAELFGPRASWVLICLWCFSPMLLAHGSLMTADAGAASLGLIAFYCYRRWLQSGRLEDAILFGVLVGAALSSKFTWLPIIPVTFLILGVAWRCTEKMLFRSFGRDIVHLLVALVICLLTVNVVYGFDQTFRPLGSLRLRSELFATKSPLATGDGNRFSGTYLASVPFPLPACVIQGIDTQKLNFESESMSRSYLMGKWQSGGWWYYYLIGLAVKSPLSVIVLGGMACYMTATRGFRFLREAKVPSGEPPASPMPVEILFFLLPAFSVIFLVSSETGFNRHLRYILLAYLFLLAFISQVGAYSPIRFRFLIPMLLAFQGASVLWAGPHWLSYFNEAAGGPKRGGEWLLGSNVDWGQDFYLLRDWRAAHPESIPCYQSIHSSYDPSLVRGNLSNRVPSNWEGIEPGWYAISVNNLYRDNPGVLERHLQTMTPVDWAGYSICIFFIP